MLTRLYSFPGWIAIAVLYFFPTEWGSKRNTTKGSRWWKYRGILSFLASTLIYAALLYGYYMGMDYDNI